MYKKLILLFAYIHNAILCVKSNDYMLLSGIKEYYTDFCVEGIDDNNNVIDVINVDLKSTYIEVSASFYQVNPKVYRDVEALKLVTDIIEDYIEHKSQNDTTLSNLILHASGIVCNNVPVIFMGKTYSGKSTVVLKLLHLLDMSTYLSDDLIIIEPDRDRRLLEISSIGLPLNVRVSSLIYNKKYKAKKLSHGTYWINPPRVIPQNRLVVSTLFEVQFSNENSCVELSGYEKMQCILRNMKYYNPYVLKSLMDYTRYLKIYKLSYHDDNFLLEKIEEFSHISINRSRQNVFDKYVHNFVVRNKPKYITIQGDSMNPSLKHNELVSVNYVHASKVKVGDIILYKKFKHYSAHRVISIGQNNREKYFATKGDSNPAPDSYHVLWSEYIGVIVKCTQLLKEDY